MTYGFNVLVCVYKYCEGTLYDKILDSIRQKAPLLKMHFIMFLLGLYVLVFCHVLIVIFIS